MIAMICLQAHYAAYVCTLLKKMVMIQIIQRKKRESEMSIACRTRLIFKNRKKEKRGTLLTFEIAINH
jgi:hypothetical protein